MPSWFVGVVGTFALSMVSGYAFLRLRCRKAGHPFGPRARWWAIATLVITATVSTGLGLAAVAASTHLRAAYIGLIVPSGLWLGAASAQRSRQRGSVVARRMAACFTFPLDRLSDRMGDDLQDWCDARLAAVSQMPQPAQSVSAAAQYYYNQVAGRLKNHRAREDLRRGQESIVHKIAIVTLIGLDTTLARLETALARHPSTAQFRKYTADDLPRLASRLETEAQNELHLFLAQAYRLGYHKMLIYPIRAEAQIRTSPAPRPLTGPGAATD
jgi:hypothetical protein